MSIPTKAPTRAEEQAEAEAYLKRGDYKRGGRLNNETDAMQDKRTIKKAVGQHEDHDHQGKPHTALKLKSGGEVNGEKSAPRMDKRARGGSMPMPESARGSGPKKAPSGGHKGSGGVNVNIISPGAADAEKKQAAAAGLQAGAKMGAAAALHGAGGPPSGAAPGSPPGAMPPGGAPPGGQPPMKRGGKC